MNNVAAVLCMLHECPDRNSATRLFRGEPVLDWTLRRLSAAASLTDIAVLCWEDQRPLVEPLVRSRRSHVLAKAPRTRIASVEAVTASRRWADGWRGGLLGTCDFDLGFYGPWVLEIAEKLEAEAVVLVDPAAGLVDPRLVDGLVAHAASHSAAAFCFTQAAPGLCGALIRKDLLGQMASAAVHPGRFLHYLPEQPGHDPISRENCFPVPTPVARCLHRFKLDSDRQVQRLHAASISLNGQLLTTGAEELVHRVNASTAPDAMPRELTLELNTTRATRPIYSATRHLKIDRQPLSIQQAQSLFAQIGSIDDVRLTLAGAGDPLLAEAVFDIIDAASGAGITAVHLETDLLGVREDQLARLAAAPVDVVSIHLPAITKPTYQAIMGVDGLDLVLANLQRLAEHRSKCRVSLPLFVPLFAKCRDNFAEMEPWYDHWLRILGSAVICGPSDCAGQIPDTALADMAPPQRRPCFRLASRMHILSDGRVVSCEQDVLGKQALGELGKQSLRDIWTHAQTNTLRAAHLRGQWQQYPLCSACRDWHRP